MIAIVLIYELSLAQLKYKAFETASNGEVIKGKVIIKEIVMARVNIAGRWFLEPHYTVTTAGPKHADIELALEDHSNA